MYYRTHFSSYEEFQREAFADPGRELSSDELELLEDRLEDEPRHSFSTSGPRRAGSSRWRPCPQSRADRSSGALATPTLAQRAWRRVGPVKLTG